MALENLSFPPSNAAIIAKLSQAIKDFDTSLPGSLHEHRRYLYLLKRLSNEITSQVNTWKDEAPGCQPYPALKADVDRELGIPHYDEQSTKPVQPDRARFSDMPEVPALGFWTSSPEIPSSPPPPRGNVPRPEYREMTGEEEERADGFATQDAQRMQMEAGVEGRDAYLGSSQDTSVDYPSSPPQDG